MSASMFVSGQSMRLLEADLSDRHESMLAPEHWQTIGTLNRNNRYNPWNKYFASW